MKDSERIRSVRKLWIERYVEKAQRTANTVLIFARWLKQKRPELLSSRHGDPFQQLKSDLRGLWND